MGGYLVKIWNKTHRKFQLDWTQLCNFGANERVSLKWKWKKKVWLRVQQNTRFFPESSSLFSGTSHQGKGSKILDLQNCWCTNSSGLWAWIQGCWKSTFNSCECRREKKTSEFGKFTRLTFQKKCLWLYLFLSNLSHCGPLWKLCEVLFSWYPLVCKTKLRWYLWTWQQEGGNRDQLSLCGGGAWKHRKNGLRSQHRNFYCTDTIKNRVSVCLNFLHKNHRTTW